MGTGQCSAGEHEDMSTCDPDLLGKCLHSITFFNKTKYEACLMSVCHIGQSCADCYGEQEAFGVDHCKVECLLGWCKQNCLDCNKPAEEAFAKCSGWQPRGPCASLS